MIIVWLVLLVISTAAYLVVTPPASDFERKRAKRNKWWQIK